MFPVKLFNRVFSILCRYNMRVRPVRALSDNFMYILSEEDSKSCAVIDPVEPHKIIEAVKSDGLTIEAILTTHHHDDHAGGNSQLVNLWKASHSVELPVYGGDSRIQAINHKVGHGDKVKIGKSLNITCLSTPCHTSGHICYRVEQSDPQEGCVFTGDTLFLSGCGRFFEGDAKQMHHALIEVLGQLPSSTKVYCGHDYTVKNLQFAQHVEPDNDKIKQRLELAKKFQPTGDDCMTGTIKDEHETNPFMRVAEPDVLKFAKTTDPIESMAFVRSAKDKF